MGKKQKCLHPGQHQAGDGCERCDREDLEAIAAHYLSRRARACRPVRTLKTGRRAGTLSRLALR